MCTEKQFVYEIVLVNNLMENHIVARSTRKIIIFLNSQTGFQW